MRAEGYPDMYDFAKISDCDGKWQISKVNIFTKT